MDPNHAIILDISSDEDFSSDDRGGGDEFDWIAEFLDTVDKENDDSDEVVVVGEIPGRLPSRKQQNRQVFGGAVKSGVKRVRVDDDDCLILDGDPDKPVSVENGKGDDDSEELLIVGEKGQLACRDYPHPRHLCATFPFSTTPHEKYCNLCHCYVCDSLAPCIYWGTGLSNTDHCHSTDKEEIWKVRRQNIKQGKTVPLPASKQLQISHSMEVPQHNLSPAFIPSQPVGCGSISQYSDARSNPLHSCSSSNFVLPNIISQGSNQCSGLVPKRNRVMDHANQPTLVPCLSSITKNAVQRIRSSSRPHCASPHLNFKRAGTSASTITKSHSAYSPSFQNAPNHRPQLQKSHHSQVECHRTRSQVFFAGSDPQNKCQRSSQPNISSSSFVDFPPYTTDSLQPQVYGQPNPLPIEDQNPYSQSTRHSSSPCMGSNFVGFNSYAESLQPQVYNNEDQNAYPCANPNPDTTNLDLSDYVLNWLDDSTTQSIALAAENTLDPVQIMPEPRPVTKPNPQYHPCVDTSSAGYDLGNWVNSLDHQSVADAAKGMLGYELGFVPHQSEMADTSSLLLFDMENSTKMVGTCSI